MQSLRRTAVSAARKGRTTLPRQSRRYAHDEHAHAHGSAPTNESFGAGFWGTVAVVPGIYILYSIADKDPNAPSYFNRLINRYTESQDKLAAQNDLHSRMMEQAGEDRVLFMNTRPHEHVEMRFPELMNNGSPYNVVAGSQVDMDKVIAKYQQQAFEDNERKLEALKNNEIKGEQELEQVIGNPTYRGKELNRAIR